MAHFAKINDDNDVLTVLTVDNSNANTEAEGQAHLETHNNWPADKWIQCSYNTRAGVHNSDASKALRKNYPSPGWLYDGIGFYPPKPHDSWVFNTSTYLWEPPKQYPKDGKTYHWDESKKDWVELGGIA